MNTNVRRFKVVPSLLAAATLVWVAACSEETPTGTGPIMDTTMVVDTVPTDTFTGELIGDFAPLSVGAKWTYDGSHMGRNGCNGGWGYGLVRVVTVTSSERRGDSTLFRFSIRDSVTGSMGYSTFPPPFFEDSVFETEEGIVANGKFPFFSAHRVVDSVAKDTIHWKGEVRPAYSITGPQSQDMPGRKTWARDLGLVYYGYGVSYPNSCAASGAIYRLRDFTRSISGL